LANADDKHQLNLFKAKEFSALLMVQTPALLHTPWLPMVSLFRYLNPFSIGNNKINSCAVWHTLEQALASTSNSRIMQLHGSLQDLRQGDDSVTQFLQKAKTLFVELAVAGRPISLTDFNLYVFRGLCGEFKDLVTSLITRADPLPYADLLSHLLTHEFVHKTSHLSMGPAASHAPLLPTPHSAILSHRQPSAQFGRNRGCSYGSW
jgi:hypothetical protein